LTPAASTASAPTSAPARDGTQGLLSFMADFSPRPGQCTGKYTVYILIQCRFRRDELENFQFIFGLRALFRLNPQIELYFIQFVWPKPAGSAQRTVFFPVRRLVGVVKRCKVSTAASADSPSHASGDARCQ